MTSTEWVMTGERREFLVDLLITFVEDFGYNGWRQIVSSNYDKGTCRILEIESPSNDEHVVDLKVIARGLSRVTEGEVRQYMSEPMTASIRLADRECDAGQLDTYDVDALVQIGLWGEAIYG